MMTDTPTVDSLTLSEPRITYERFLALLKTKNSPAVPEARKVYDILIAEGVEPAFALAQFRVESQYGTSGWAEESGSWGNMIYSPNLTILSGPILVKTTGGHTYKFATYTNYVDAITDYCRYIHWYKDEYGLDTIYEATGRWLGLNRTGDPGHVNYCSIIVADMIEYQFPPGEFYETGDAMIWMGDYIDRVTGKLNTTLYVPKGTRLYRGTSEESFLKVLEPAPDPITKKRPPGLHLFFLGRPNDAWDWGMVLVGTSSADPKGTGLYIQDPDKTKLKVVPAGG